MAHAAQPSPSNAAHVNHALHIAQLTQSQSADRRLRRFRRRAQRLGSAWLGLAKPRASRGGKAHASHIVTMLVLAWLILGPKLAQPLNQPQPTMNEHLSTTGSESGNFDLFATVPTDFLHLGIGKSLDAKRVAALLALKREDVSKIATVSPASVRYDESMPQSVRDRLEEIASIMNMVANTFAGDEDKTVSWFKARNPLLGDISPRDMIRLGRYERLRRFVINALISRRDAATSNEAASA